ncbi:cytochrome b560 subunit of succinate dehydrogenase [Testicularia cyperi]|uniref:Cytochrome b560 subunit of succinate dehydrogenase n=1 Tax=Testicularia cyperi TaxID=1882483 RepID=A0A317XG63_9BASI|nr:cytochrome b560 subunit of succinate dehydrogenase [Testicularia cyperi]
MTAAARLPVNKAISVSARGAATQAAAPTTQYTQQQNLELLNQHRAQRPTSPHFTIYQPQYTWILSILNRITGTGLSVLLYGYFAAYAGLPLLGFTEALSSTALVDFIAHLPAWLKLAIKAPLAFAFSFHNINGLRHLAWDWGIGLTIKGVYRGAYAVMAATAISTVGLCLI